MFRYVLVSQRKALWWRYLENIFFRIRWAINSNFNLHALRCLNVFAIQCELIQLRLTTMRKNFVCAQRWHFDNKLDNMKGHGSLLSFFGMRRCSTSLLRSQSQKAFGNVRIIRFTGFHAFQPKRKKCGTSFETFLVMGLNI